MQTIDMNYNRSLIVFYCYFRVILAILLFSIAVIDQQHGIPGQFESQAFAAVCLLYLLLTIFQSGYSFKRKFTIPDSWLLFAIGLDILTTLVLIHISGGLTTGFAILLITPICIAAIFFQGSLATSFAAIASIGILADGIFYDLIIEDRQSHLVPAGLFGMIFFAASLCVQFLSNKIKNAQDQASNFALKAQTMAELNRQIVHKIRTGVIIFDAQNRAILYNQAAEQLLSPFCDDIKQCASVVRLLHQWKQSPSNNHKVLKAHEKGSDIKVNFSAMDQLHAIAFIEDMTEVAQQALQMKLASLGRLSASIAHEIRNPLNAISHAVQLLEETPTLTKDDHYLLNIAKNHCQRINEIVSNIQFMSQRRGYKPEKLNLATFCEQLRQDYSETRTLDEFIIDYRGKDFIAPFDPTQLRQIISNLIDNALRYSYKKTQQQFVKIVIGKNQQNQTCFIQVFDLGEGVPKANQSQLFEPFFTSEATGTGLGLYISRELCTLNQSQLTYHHNEEHYFQIAFAHAERDIVVNNNQAMEYA